MSSAGTADRLHQLVDIARLIAREPDTVRLIERILLTAKDATQADGGSLYLVEDDRCTLSYALIVNDTLGLHLGGASAMPVGMQAPALYDRDGAPNHRSVVTHCVLGRESIRLDDAYTAEGYDFAGARAFDQAHGYRSRSFLAVPMIDHAGEVTGVLQLVNAHSRDGSVGVFCANDQAFVEALTGLAAIALDKQGLIERLQALFESLVRLINDAIDEKSPYTGGHCRRVPELAMMLADAAHRTQEGPLADFRLSATDRRELWLAAMLHDCGKITTPVHVVDKATKLSGIFDRMTLIEARFDGAAREARIAYLEAVAAGEAETAAASRYRAELAALDADRAFLREANRGSERMADEDIARVRAIGARRVRGADGALQPLLSEDETANLTIPYGTLNATERAIINGHVTTTIRMLESLPWPRHLARVPEYAGGHHERVDGKGYPRGLTREQMSLPARMIAIADVFEALTAADRPYKRAKTVAESLAILGQMKQSGHVDPDLFDVFLREGVWLDYARKFLAPEQFDEGDLARVTDGPALPDQGRI
jgi:HD-GYP domain-containing protein (c-di-GMP phosphodiesterase class II)